ncbi:UNVERIFIED_CONTAM: hypothetical protein K2H54_039034 [Gekko kuhli]
MEEMLLVFKVLPDSHFVCSHTGKIFYSTSITFKLDPILKKWVGIRLGSFIRLQAELTAALLEFKLVGSTEVFSFVVMDMHAFLLVNLWLRDFLLEGQNEAMLIAFYIFLLFLDSSFLSKAFN